MKKTNILTFLALFLAVAPLAGQQNRIQASPDGDVSLKLEIQRAIDKGIAYLKSKQDAKTGSWSDSSTTALTGLPLSAMLGDPSRNPEAPLAPEIEKGLAFILKSQQSDGGLYVKGLATYNTAISMMALIQSGKKEYFPVIAKARRLLINQQQDYDRKGQADNLFDGGVGYGSSGAHSDLSNTVFAMEALHYSKQLLSDTEFADKDFDLDWNAAIEFVSLCQNTEKTVKRLGDTVGLRKEDEGGFVYFPGSTKSEEIQLADGKRVALRSYGSISYAGLLAFIYADMDQGDPRIQAALKWLQNNYTLEENPGMEAQGLYYYYHTMAKALSVGQINSLKTPDGKTVNWRRDLALKTLANQATDGSWINGKSNRWMENDPILVTSYSLLALEHIYRGL